jgi:hypothetical protein
MDKKITKRIPTLFAFPRPSIEPLQPQSLNFMKESAKTFGISGNAIVLVMPLQLYT